MVICGAIVGMEETGDGCMVFKCGGKSEYRMGGLVWGRGFAENTRSGRLRPGNWSRGRSGYPRSCGDGGMSVCLSLCLFGVPECRLLFFRWRTKRDEKQKDTMIQPGGGGSQPGEGGGRCSVHNCTRLFCTYTSPPSRWPISTPEPPCPPAAALRRRTESSSSRSHHASCRPRPTARLSTTGIQWLRLWPVWRRKATGCRATTMEGAAKRQRQATSSPTLLPLA